MTCYAFQFADSRWLYLKDNQLIRRGGKVSARTLKVDEICGYIKKIKATSGKFFKPRYQ